MSARNAAGHMPIDTTLIAEEVVIDGKARADRSLGGDEFLDLRRVPRERGRAADFG